MASDNKVVNLFAYKAKKEGGTFVAYEAPAPVQAPAPKIAQNQKERRQRPRIKYHFSRRPMIFVNEIAFRVINVSEYGVKFIAPASHIPLVESRVSGYLYIGATNRFKFDADVIRVIGDLVSLQFDEPIPSEAFQNEIATADASQE